MEPSYPFDHHQLSVESLTSCSYTSFVGRINQWNVPPGAFDTLNRWATSSRLRPESHLLEIASTTGFSSRELARISDCSAVGVDISADSVRTAEFNRDRYGAGLNLKYECADALNLPEREKFSHIVIGAAAGFFPDPREVGAKCARLLDDGGFLLASPFYVSEEPPQALVDEAEEVFGIRVTTYGLATAMEPYKGFEIHYEQHFVPRQETPAELEHYCTSTIDRFQRDSGVRDANILDAAYIRLLRIKEMSNALRPFQRWATLTLCHRKDVYPDRYVEVF